MNFLKKSIFAFHKTNGSPTANQEQLSEHGFSRYAEEGFIQSRLNNGEQQAFKININLILQNLLDRYNNQQQQQELKKIYREKLESMQAEKGKIADRIAEIKTTEKENLHEIILQSRKRISELYTQPAAAGFKRENLVSYSVAIIFFLFLTTYLFLFYSSAAYAAFYHGITHEQHTIATIIFNPHTLANAWHDGFAVFLMVVTIPFVFLALGYLIHKLTDKKSIIGYLKATAVFLAAFLFNGIVSYEIVKNSYLAGTTEQGIKTLYKLSTATSDAKFWIIMIAGFVVYLIWCMIFEFVFESKASRYRFKGLVGAEKNNIRSYEGKLQRLDIEFNELIESRESLKKQIRIHEATLELVFINIPELEKILYDYLGGWTEWMNYKRMPAEQVQEIEQVTAMFLNNIRKQYEVADS